MLSQIRKRKSPSSDNNTKSKKPAKPIAKKIKTSNVEQPLESKVTSKPIAKSSGGVSVFRPWTQLNPSLSPDILEGIDSFGFTGMTPVQAATIPAFLSHKDVCVQAVTGSGKTMAFVIPMLEILSKKQYLKHDLGAIILTPTRELSKQITTIVTQFVPFLKRKLSVCECIGGRDVQADIQSIFENGCNILVATPGRLEWVLATQSFINHRSLELLILDEADRLLDLGFASSLEKILKIIPKQRRTGLFSATLTSEVEELAKTGLRNPVKITVRVQYKTNDSEGTDKPAHQAIPTSLTNYYSLVKPEYKLFHLVDFLLKHKDEKVIIFFLTCADVDYFYRVLATFPAIADVFTPHNKEVLEAIGAADLVTFDPSRPILAPMHGKMPQNKRDNLYQTFRNTPSGALLCTDVAARGVDIPEVDWILQFDAPQNPDFFIHRIGRAARAGRQGSAVVFLNENEDTFIEFLSVKSVPISELKLEQPPQEWIDKLWKPVDEKYYAQEVSNDSDSESEMDDEDSDSDSGSDSDMDDEDSEDESKQISRKGDKNDRIKERRVVIPGGEEKPIDLPVLPSFENMQNVDNTNIYLLQRVDLKRKDKRELKKMQEKQKYQQKKAKEDEENFKRTYRLPFGTRVEVVHDDTHIVQHARWLNSRDRHMFNLGSNAYVSHIRAYKEHKCKYIFIFDDLPFRHVAIGFGLIMMPQLPDLKRYNIKYPKITRTQANDIPFQDASREENRVELLEKKREKNQQEKAERMVKQMQRKIEKEKRQAIREKKKKNRTKVTYEEMEDEWLELAQETKALKQMRKGKLTEDEFERAAVDFGRAKVNKNKIRSKILGEKVEKAEKAEMVKKIKNKHVKDDGLDVNDHDF